MIAAVGLDLDRRAQASRLLAQRRREPGVTVRSKIDLAYLALEIEDWPDLESDEASAKLLLSIFQHEGNPYYRARWEPALQWDRARMEPNKTAPALLNTLKQ